MRFGLPTTSILCLFPFRKRSLPFLTVDAIGNQAFSHGSGLGLGLGLPITYVTAMKDGLIIAYSYIFRSSGGLAW